jgi:C4-dicarboxylate transporter, DctQ subunit
MKGLEKASQIFDRLINLLAIVAVILISLMGFLICFEVVARLFVTRPMLWTVEISEYLLVYITFFGTAWVLKEEGHVAMDLFLTRLRPRPRCAMNVATSLIGAIISLICVWYGAKVTIEYCRTGYFLSKILDFPFFIVAAVFPVGWFLLFIQFLVRAYKYVEGYKRDMIKEEIQTVGGEF